MPCIGIGKHVFENKNSDEEESSRNNINTGSESVFQKASENLEPPLKNPMKNQESKRNH